MKSPKISKKELIAMDRASVSIKGVFDDIKTQISRLDQEIKTSEKSKLEFERQLLILETRRDDLKQQIKSNESWASVYDTEVGPLAKKYNEMTASIGKIYDKAKDGHKKGIVVLKQEFGYHPAFKRPKDTFTAVPFQPK
eukprot:gene22136-28662_t